MNHWLNQPIRIDMFDPLYYLGVLVVIVMTITVMCIAVLKYFPTSKLSGWIRKHIITDDDLEPL